MGQTFRYNLITDPASTKSDRSSWLKGVFCEFLWLGTVKNS